MNQPLDPAKTRSFVALLIGDARSRRTQLATICQWTTSERAALTNVLTLDESTDPSADLPQEVCAMIRGAKVVHAVTASELRPNLQIHALADAVVAASLDDHVAVGHTEVLEMMLAQHGHRLVPTSALAGRRSQLYSISAAFNS